MNFSSHMRCLACIMWQLVKTVKTRKINTGNQIFKNGIKPFYLYIYIYTYTYTHTYIYVCVYVYV